MLNQVTRCGLQSAEAGCHIYYYFSLRFISFVEMGGAVYGHDVVMACIEHAL